MMTEEEFVEKANLSRHQVHTWLESGLLEARTVNVPDGPFPGHDPVPTDATQRTGSRVSPYPAAVAGFRTYGQGQNHNFQVRFERGESRKPGTNTKACIGGEANGPGPRAGAQGSAGGERPLARRRSHFISSKPLARRRGLPPTSKSPLNRQSSTTRLASSVYEIGCPPAARHRKSRH
jgi:hypothetical protein